MKIYEISQSYSWNKLVDMHKNLGKGIPYIVKTTDGIRILVTHGNKDGKIKWQQELSGSYDKIIACYFETSHKKWTTIRKYSTNGEEYGSTIWRFFLFEFETAEMLIANNETYLQMASNEINKEVIEETEKEISEIKYMKFSEMPMYKQFKHNGIIFKKSADITAQNVKTSRFFDFSNVLNNQFEIVE